MFFFFERRRIHQLKQQQQQPPKVAQPKSLAQHLELLSSPRVPDDLNPGIVECLPPEGTIIYKWRGKKKNLFQI